MGTQNLPGPLKNIQWKAQKRLRALLRRDSRELAAAVQEAMHLVIQQTHQPNWPTVSPVIDRNDMMYEGEALFYFSSGYSALQCIRRALDKAGKTPVKSILDFGCGHGRVLRTLAAEFPDAALVAADTNKSGVNFCAKQFNAQPIHSNTEFSNLVFPAKFDLIWVGSVFTHISAERWTTLLELLRSTLADDGLLVFSTHGPDAERRLRDQQVLLFNLEPDRIARILANYDAQGFGYCDYRRYPGYGVSLSSVQWVTRQVNAVGMEVISYQESAWDNFHDVWDVRPIDASAADSK
jgi:SAM-dependent methyltransferase